MDAMGVAAEDEDDDGEGTAAAAGAARSVSRFSGVYAALVYLLSYSLLCALHADGGWFSIFGSMVYLYHGLFISVCLDTDAVKYKLGISTVAIDPWDLSPRMPSSVAF